MALVRYTRPVTDTLNDAVVAGKLGQEVRAAEGITIALDHINVVGSDIEFWFKATLPAEDQTTLNAVVASHDGVPPEKTESVHVENFQAEDDQKIAVVPIAATEGFNTWITSRGDEGTPTPPATGRGTGQQILIDTFLSSDDPVTYPKTQQQLVQFSEPMEMHDGKVMWGRQDMADTPEFTYKDYFSVGISMPATPYTAAPGGDGNADTEPVAPSAYALKPAANGNDGFQTIDLAQGVPIQVGAGHPHAAWVVDRLTGAISAPTADTAPAAIKWAMYSFPNQGWIIRCVTMANKLQMFDIDANVKVEYVHPSWQLIFEVTKVDKPAADCFVTGWLLGFRTTPQ